LQLPIGEAPTLVAAKENEPLSDGKLPTENALYGCDCRAFYTKPVPPPDALFATL